MATTSRAELVDELLALVEKVYPDWSGFDDPRYVHDERAYKFGATELAAQILARDDLYAALKRQGPEEVVLRVKRVAQKTNLLYLSTPLTGDLEVLERDNLPIELRARLIIDLLHGHGSTAQRLDQYREHLSSVGLKAYWPLPTYLLFLMAPTKEVFVKPSVMRWLKLRIPDLLYHPIVSSVRYKAILELHIDLTDELQRRGLMPVDLIDIQSFLWLAFHSERGPLTQGHSADEAKRREEEVSTGGGARPVEAEEEVSERGEARDTEARVPIHHDAPAVVDELQRRPLAKILADRIRQGFAASGGPKGEHSAFAVHLYGSWGSGKSTLLDYLEKELRNAQPPWIIVRFDAWKHQRIRPPWWPLIREVYEHANRSLTHDAHRRAHLVWWGWRLRVSLLPLLLSAATIVAFGIALLLFAEDGSFDLGTTVSILAGVAALLGVLQTKNRSLLLGGSKAAEAYLELSGDPLGPLTELFRRLTSTYRHPIGIFVDDLDRCDGDAVVDLLEGIQTLFRQAPVVYVVAADRNWVRTSFEQRYNSFLNNVGQPGRPLGHLFLEKIFQISIPVPRLTPDTWREYWQRLLVRGSVDSVEEAQARLVREGAEILGDATSPEEIQQIVDENKGTAVESGVRMAAAERLSTPGSIKQAEHELSPYASLLEPNPRAMKRLVNTFGLQQQINLLSHVDVKIDPLVRWTILQQRWPELADVLAERPDLLKLLRDGGEQNDARIPERLAPLFHSSEVHRVIVGEDGLGGLDESTLRRLAGVEPPTLRRSGV